MSEPDQEHRSRRNHRRRLRRRVLHAGGPGKGNGTRVVTSLDHVPLPVLQERDARERALGARTASQRLLGDPPPGFSALDKRTRG